MGWDGCVDGDMRNLEALAKELEKGRKVWSKVGRLDLGPWEGEDVG